jgi:DNA-binding response OmpR family regulator
MSEPKVILIVEDEESLRDAVSKQLATHGYTVHEAENGQVGLAIALREKPDLILLDQHMPIVDGTTMLMQLREDPWGSDASVIMMTNMTEIETLNKSLQAGVDDYIIKADVKLAQIVDLVQNRLKKPKG